MNTSTPDSIEALLAEMVGLRTMERGTLSEEYRNHPGRGGVGIVRLGPYFKHQVRKNGGNVIRRVSEAEVPACREALANYRRFMELAHAFVDLIVAHSRAQGGAQTSPRRPRELNKSREQAWKGGKKKNVVLA